MFPPSGDLENRAVIREPATLLITNATRSDTARYRCEVTAADDQKTFDEIVIDLVVRGTSIIHSCVCACFQSVLHEEAKIWQVPEVLSRYCVLKERPCLVIHTLDAVR